MPVYVDAVTTYVTRHGAYVQPGIRTTIDSVIARMSPL
jgi:hypothetical protein